MACRDAAHAFVRDHLARWCAKLRTRLEGDAGGEVYRAAGQVLAGFVALDLSAVESPARARPRAPEPRRVAEAMGGCAQ